jgi:hypothetical protein
MTTHYQTKLKAVLSYFETCPDMILPTEFKNQKEATIIALKEAIKTVASVSKNGGLKVVMDGFNATQKSVFDHNYSNEA